MQLNFRKLILFFFITIGCHSLNGQTTRRTCDLEPLLESPMDTITVGERVDLELKYKNNGPDKLINSDSIILKAYFIDDYGDTGIVHSSITSGQGSDTIPLNQLIAYSDNFTLDATFLKPRVYDFCVQIFSEVLMDNGDSAICAYYDPQKDNDHFCKKLTIMPKATTAIAEIDGSGMAFFLYPNPASDKLYIQAASNKNQGATQVAIRDITGRVMTAFTYDDLQMVQRTVAVDIAKFPIGIYTISLQTGSERYTKKFSINH